MINIPMPRCLVPGEQSSTVRGNMLRNHLWGVFRVVLLLPTVLFMAGCEDGDALPGVKPPAADAGAGQGRGVAATGLVSGGTVMRSSRYRLVGSMTPGVADGTVGKSPQFIFRSGLVGASQ
jgi:hypothetical protein